MSWFCTSYGGTNITDGKLKFHSIYYSKKPFYLRFLVKENTKLLSPTLNETDLNLNITGPFTFFILRKIIQMWSLKICWAGFYFTWPVFIGPEPVRRTNTLIKGGSCQLSY